MNGFRQPKKPNKGKFRTKTLLSHEERLAQLEQRVEVVVTSSNNVLDEVGDRMSDITRSYQALVEALGDILGAHKVEAAVKLAGDRIAERRNKAARAALEAAVESGSVVAVGAAGPETIVTGVERKADGTEIPPGYVQIHYDDTRPDVQKALGGKAKGDTVPMPSGATFEILGVFKQAEVDDKEA